MKKSIILLMCGIATLIGSCKKDSSEPSNTEKLCGKNWKIISATVDPGIVTPGGTTVTDIYAQTPACQKDNFTSFNTNGSYTDDEGLSKCSTTDPQNTTGIWKFNSTETILTLDNTDSYNILQNDGSVLKFNYSKVNSTNGITYVYTITLNK